MEIVWEGQGWLKIMDHNRFIGPTGKRVAWRGAVKRLDVGIGGSLPCLCLRLVRMRKDG